MSEESGKYADFAALFTPNPGQYAHIAKDCEITIKLTAEESAALMQAYDYGLDLLGDRSHQINAVIAKIKDQIWA